MYSFPKKKTGFTIIELIISIFILSIAVVGIFSAFSIMVILTSDVADRFTATYLAQEGEEIVRNIRDTNWLNMDECASDSSCTSGTYTWVDELTSGSTNQGIDCTIGFGCEADYTTTTSTSSLGAWPMTPWPASSGSGGGDYLKIDASGSGFYNYASGTQTKFKRKIIITPVTDVDGDSSHIINVEVQVSWDHKANILSPGALANNCGPTNCIKVESTLYNWYDYSLQ